MDSQHFLQGGVPLSYDQIANRYESVYASTYTAPYNSGATIYGPTLTNDYNSVAYISDSSTMIPSYQPNGVIASTTATKIIGHCPGMPSSSRGVMSSADLSRILLKVDQSASSQSNHSSSDDSIVVRTHPVFNPYGPTMAKLPRRDESKGDKWNGDETPNNGSSLNSSMAINVLPTVNLMAHIPEKDLRLTNGSTQIRKSLQLADGLNNGSFNSMLSVSTPTANLGGVETPKSSGLTANQNASFFSLPSLLSATSTAASTSSLMSLTKSADPVMKYGKMGRFVFGTDNKPLRLFFTKALYFSNHHPCERLRIDGVNYSCTEQYYMYYKAHVFGDAECARAIMQTTEPKVMKRLGASVVGFIEEQWNRIAILVMVIASMHKYEQNAELRRNLFQTVHSQLVEANPTDQRWGIGLSIDSELAADQARWRGQNWMGRLLTMLRDRLLQRPEFAAELRDLYAEHPYDLAGEHILVV